MHFAEKLSWLSVQQCRGPLDIHVLGLPIDEMAEAFFILVNIVYALEEYNLTSTYYHRSYSSEFALDNKKLFTNNLSN